MSLHNYLELFRQAIENKEGVIVDASLPDVADILDEVVGFL